MISLAVLVLLGVVIVLAVRRAPATPGGGSDGHAVRRFFQYLLLYGLLVVGATGLGELLGRALDRSTVLASDPTGLARDVAFTVVGLPLLTLLALWSRRRVAADPEETGSLGWAFFVTAGPLTALAVAMTALHDVLTGLLGVGPANDQALGRLLVWGVAWLLLFLLDARATPPARSLTHLLTGSTVGLATAVVGLSGLLGASLAELWGVGAGAPALAGGAGPVPPAAVTLAVGAPVWLAYWLGRTARQPRGTAWLAYVLLVGVGGGLVLALAAASVALYSALVWLLGDPAGASATVHFAGTPRAVAVALVGALVWWYHRAVLARDAPPGRTEVRRVQEYLVAGIGLATAAVGLTMLLTGAVEAATGTVVLAGGATVNTLLAAVTMLLVGGPVWAVFWRRTGAAARASTDEVASPTRRVYLFVLFGVGGVAAVVALIVGVYLGVEATIEGSSATATLRAVRVPLGVLLTTGAVSAYHWTVYAEDRARLPRRERTGPRFVLLVGPGAQDLAAAVARGTGGRVEHWVRTDEAGTWLAEEVLAALADADADEVVVLHDAKSGPRVLPVDRSGRRPSNLR